MNIQENIKKKKTKGSEYSYRLVFDIDEIMHSEAIEAISRFQKEKSLNIKDSIISMLATYYAKENKITEPERTIVKVTEKKIREKPPIIKEEVIKKSERNSPKEDVNKTENKDSGRKGFKHDPNAQAKLKALMQNNFK